MNTSILKKTFWAMWEDIRFFVGIALAVATVILILIGVRLSLDAIGMSLTEQVLLWVALMFAVIIFIWFKDTYNTIKRKEEKHEKEYMKAKTEQEATTSYIEGIGVYDIIDTLNKEESQ